MPGKPYRKPGRKNWVVVVELPPDPATGKRRQRTLSGATRREVAEKQAALLREVATGTALDPSTLTVAQFLGRWLAEVVRPTRAVRTYETAESHVRVHLVPALGGHLLTALRPAHVAAMLAAIQRDGASAKTAINIRMTLHTALNHAMKQWQLVPRNVADLVDPPRHEPLPADLWSDRDLAAFLSAVADRRFAALYHLTLNTGMRQAEVLGLRWADLDAERGVLMVRRQVARSRTQGYITQVPKGKRARPVTLTPEVVAMLAAHRAAQAAERADAGDAWAEEDRIFPNGRGGPLARETLYHDWLRTIRRLGLPHMVFHGLRHLHATYLLMEGTHPKVVADRLGHSSTAVTMETYSHAIPSLQREAAGAFARALARAIGRPEAPDK